MRISQNASSHICTSDPFLACLYPFICTHRRAVTAGPWILSFGSFASAFIPHIHPLQGFYESDGAGQRTQDGNFDAFVVETILPPTDLCCRSTTPKVPAFPTRAHYSLFFFSCGRRQKPKMNLNLSCDCEMKTGQGRSQSVHARVRRLHVSFTPDAATLVIVTVKLRRLGKELLVFFGAADEKKSPECLCSKLSGKGSVPALDCFALRGKMCEP